MSTELENTLKKRHEKIVAYTAKIWELEKEKYNFRADFVHHSTDLSVARNASAKFAMTQADNDLSLAASAAVSQDSLARDKAEIDKIKAAQLIYLGKIKAILEL